MTIDSGSTRNRTATRNAPTATQSKTWTWMTRSEAGLVTRSIRSPTDTAKAAATSAEANHPGALPRHLRPVSSSTAAPRRGRAGTSAASLTAASPSEQPGVVHVRGPGLAVEGHDDGEPHHHLRRRHHHREEGDDLSGQVPLLAGEGNQGQVDRVQLELDGHEDDQSIAADQDAD